MWCSVNTIFGCLSIFPRLFDYAFFAPLLIRLGLAAIFIVHGYPKLFGGLSDTSQFFSSVGIKPGRFWAPIVGMTEFFGGFLLIIGLFVQPVAIALAIDMLIAIWKVKYKQGFVNGYELDLALLVMALALAILGGGAYSIDLPL